MIFSFGWLFDGLSIQQGTVPHALKDAV